MHTHSPTVADLFRRQVATSPDTVAVSHGAAELTYRRLDYRSDHLASRLSRLGVERGGLVGIALDNSIDLIVALLAVVKSGAGYVPVATSDPRAASILGDAGVEVVVGSAPIGSAVLVRPDQDPGVPPCSLEPGPGPRDIAYVIYTSGSTGRPKGVVVEHESLAAYLIEAAAAYPGLAGRVLVHSSPAFDLAVTSLFGPLIVGGTIEIVSLDSLPPRDGFVPPTFLKVTPAHLTLLRTQFDHLSPTVDLVIGGDALTAAMLEHWRLDHPGVTVVNEYGPTEATVGCSTYRVPPGRGIDTGPVPIGRDWRDDAGLFVLDQGLSSAVSGELYIAGPQLARGYLGNPGATAASFVANPFGAAGSRMYRSGDRVVRRSDGELEFIGRLDGQLAISGFRVEPAEVVAVLSSVDSVAHVVVMAYDSGDGAMRLAAYVLAAPDAVLDGARLSEYASAHLPWHLVPAAIVVLETLPLTANGKIDHAALPHPSAAPESLARHTDSVMTDRTSDEELVCRMIEELVGIATVDVDDDFFGLGGTSLAAARLVTRARRNGIQFTLTDVLNKRTVRRLLDSLRPAPHCREKCCCPHRLSSSSPSWHL
jgi:amino acid adenylation domain-containing protein